MKEENPNSLIVIFAVIGCIGLGISIIWTVYMLLAAAFGGQALPY